MVSGFKIRSVWSSCPYLPYNKLSDKMMSLNANLTDLNCAPNLLHQHSNPVFNNRDQSLGLNTEK